MYLKSWFYCFSKVFRCQSPLDFRLVPHGERRKDKRSNKEVRLNICPKWQKKIKKTEEVRYCQGKEKMLDIKGRIESGLEKVRCECVPYMVIQEVTVFPKYYIFA